MKAKFPKIHLIDVAEPLLTFCNLTCRCGKQIENAEMRFAHHEAELTKETMLPIATCGNCSLLPPEGELRRTYIYGVRDKAEVRAWEQERGRECGQGDSAA